MAQQVQEEEKKEENIEKYLFEETSVITFIKLKIGDEWSYLNWCGDNTMACLGDKSDFSALEIELLSPNIQTAKFKSKGKKNGDKYLRIISNESNESNAYFSFDGNTDNASIFQCHKHEKEDKKGGFVGGMMRNIMGNSDRCFSLLNTKKISNEANEDEEQGDDNKDDEIDNMIIVEKVKKEKKGKKDDKSPDHVIKLIKCKLSNKNVSFFEIDFVAEPNWQNEYVFDASSKETWIVIKSKVHNTVDVFNGEGDPEYLHCHGADGIISVTKKYKRNVDGTTWKIYPANNGKTIQIKCNPNMVQPIDPEDKHYVQITADNNVRCRGRKEDEWTYFNVVPTKDKYILLQSAKDTKKYIAMNEKVGNLFVGNGEGDNCKLKIYKANDNYLRINCFSER